MNFILKKLEQAGVKEFCLCPGGRNAPLIQALLAKAKAKAKKVSCYYFVDERSAAFFALGRTLATGSPAAVVVTSGTAVAETLPAVIEGHYLQQPLVILSADRPPHYRGTGSPQAISQVGLFSNYVEACYDLSLEKDFEISHFVSPIHINICFTDEEAKRPLASWDLDMKPLDMKPLGAKNKNLPSHLEEAAPKLRAQEQAVLAVGAVPEQNKKDVLSYLSSWKGLLYVEADSGFLQHLSSHPGFLQFSQSVSYAVTQFGFQVIRVGGLPSASFWRSLTKDDSVMSFSHLPYSGVPGLLKKPWPLSYLSKLQVSPALHPEVLSYEKKLRAWVLEGFHKYPLSEPALVYKMSKAVDKEPLFLGNSLPIRLWSDFAASSSSMDPQKVGAFRGANGIDGQVSGFLGFAQQQPCWGLLGDLTLLHDMSAFDAARKRAHLKLRLGIMNNKGGGIFRLHFPKIPEIVNPHNYSMEDVARFWGWKYISWPPQDISLDFVKALPQRACLLEMSPDDEQTAGFFQKMSKVK